MHFLTQVILSSDLLQHPNPPYPHTVLCHQRLLTSVSVSSQEISNKIGYHLMTSLFPTFSSLLDIPLNLCSTITIPILGNYYMSKGLPTLIPISSSNLAHHNYSFLIATRMQSRQLHFPSTPLPWFQPLATQSGFPSGYWSIGG